MATVTRPGHPLAGTSMPVAGAMSRLGRWTLLLVLPDGSKALIPAEWTDAPDTEAAEQGPSVLALPADLLEAVVLVSALRARAPAIGAQAASKSPAKEDFDAACPAQFDTRPDPDATAAGGPLAPGQGGRRRGRDPRSGDRQGRGGQAEGSRR
jgi:uncharacterized protein DUF5372